MTEPVSAIPSQDEPSGERIQKVLARAGFGSRRACEILITQGRVSVDGNVAVLGQRVDAEKIRLAVDGIGVPTAPSLVHYLLNKPAGVVTTAWDPQGRPTVLSLVPEHPRVFPVGRLDMATEGLLVMTNDGEFAQLLAHPSHGVPKEYLVEVEGTPTPGAVRSLRNGVRLDDGVTAPARVGVLGPGLLRIVIHEGKNRQIRRMCQEVGNPVRRLVRTRIGPVQDKSLQPGQWRSLTNAELRGLIKAASTPTRTSPTVFPGGGL